MHGLQDARFHYPLRGSPPPWIPWICLAPLPLTRGGRRGMGRATSRPFRCPGWVLASA